jgi:DNA-binding MarR family transcriptional regulator
MTRPYILCRLLEHGPLTWVQLVEITGWKSGTMGRATERCLQRGLIRRTAQRGTRRFLYERA